MADPTRMLGHIRSQAEYCDSLGSPFYAVLLRHVADDVESGGPAARVLAGHEDDPGPSALAVRLMGSVHRLVLDGSAPALTPHYPSVGGDGDAEAAWPGFRDLLDSRAPALRELLGQPPQTNEVGRAAALIGGLQHVLAWRAAPLRLTEIGASGGLNLRADRFRLELADGRAVGPAGSPVVLRDAWRGNLPPVSGRPEVVARFGCDRSPLDPTTSDGRLLLTAYVWADQHERLDRLRGALAVAAEVPAVVERATAGEFVRRLALVPGTTTVLWHSVMWQYLDHDERAEVSARLAQLGAEADADAGLAHLSLEPRRRTPEAEHEFLVVLRTWPGGEERVLGRAQPHGVPVDWE